MPSAPAGVVDALQSSLVLHWSAAEAYETQAAHFSRWGFPKIGDELAADAAEERGHIGKLLARLEYYDAMPERKHDAVEWPRDDFPGVLEVNYQLEAAAAGVERSGYATALAAGDPVTADVFLDLLADSEKSIREIEATKTVIASVGLDNYLANKA